MASTDGFVRLPNWLIDDSDLSWNELAVYIVLLRFRDPKTGECFPGMTTIADRARISRKTVERVIPKLEARQMIRVKRRSTLTVNTPNVYTVALADETPKFIWEKSARGRRVPKHPRKKPTDTESVGADAPGEPTDTESVPTDTESPPPQTQSRPNKIQVKKIHQQALTPTFSESGSEDFSFDGPGADRATERQVAYLKDLAIHLGYETGGGVPNDLQLQRWRKLSREEADTQIRGYLKALGKPDEIYYPQAGDPEFAALSDAGKEFAESAGDPASVWEYGFKLKENGI
ncbi:helix-turn-helix domain-containing protein [Microbacterium sp. 3J1]|uniref:helix-turn-helix domain-containing protein n=1 Tax=Microbacterium sp. 3J1 TaxID=861269 RepID=UPI000A5D6181|nr:helix-turn-helix domain-containing protein [Microbacterium sp. 3J1]